MNSPTLTDPVTRQARGRTAATPVAPALNPNRIASVQPPREPGARCEDEDLGPWVRLPGGGLELQICGDG